MTITALMMPDPNEIKADEQYGRIVYRALFSEWRMGNAQNFTRHEIKRATGLNENQFASGLLWAKDFADENGYCIPDACARNNFTYYLTDAPEEVIGSAWHATRKAVGATNSAQRQAGFVARNADRMEGHARRVGAVIGHLNTSQQSNIAAMNEIMAMSQDVYDDWVDEISESEDEPALPGVMSGEG